MARLHLLLLFGACIAPAAGHCRGLDRSALIAMYDALDGARWINNRHWNTTTGTSAQNKANDPCDPLKRWYGVGFIDPCEKYLDDILGEGVQTDYLTRVRGSGQGCFAGRITSLTLRRNDLFGNISIPEIGDLENLTYVDLTFNSLYGALPTQIGRLNNVQVIHLSNNNISGPLPTELGMINSKGPTAERGCGLDDPCPVGTQLKLESLSMHHNALTGPIPSQLGDLVHLTQLDLGVNNLTGTVPSQLGRLSNLQVLFLRENELSGPLPPGVLHNLTQMRYLLLNNNALTGGVPSEIGRLRELSDLHMYENRLDAELPDELGDAILLQDLQLQDNLIPGTIPFSIGNLVRLRHLDLYNNAMTGDVPASIQNLTNSEQLYLDNVHLTPLRNYYCRQRIPNVGKYNWNMMREQYRHMTAVTCDNPHDVDYTFNTLQHSRSYDATS